MATGTTDGSVPPAQRADSPARRRIHLSGTQETLVIPLYAHALDFRSRRSILHDERAEEIVRAIDYDFERLRSPGGRFLVARCRELDEWVREFLRARGSAIVLNLGCGLDTRFSRIGPPPSVQWFDLDFPDVIALRRTFFSDGESYRMLATSMTEPGWVEQLPSDRPVIAVADGVFPYLSGDEVRELLRRLTAHFPHGQVVFDVANSSAVRRGNEKLKGTSGATLRWAVDDLRAVDSLNPKLQRTGTVLVLGSKYLPASWRILFAFARWSPGLRTVMRAVRYEF